MLEFIHTKFECFICNNTFMRGLEDNHGRYKNRHHQSYYPVVTLSFETTFKMELLNVFFKFTMFL